MVTVMVLRACSSPIDCRILSIPLGPRVVFTRSAIAIAPTNDCYKEDTKSVYSCINGFGISARPDYMVPALLPALSLKGLPPY